MRLGIVMSEESEQESDLKNRVSLLIVGIFFILQFFFSFFHFNTQGVALVTLTGWLLLIPGFLLISVSESIWKRFSVETEKGETDNPNRVKRYISGLTPHPLSDGWVLIVIALALISQDWFSFVCMGVQLPFLFVSFYNE